jgi:hypothetical protein
MSADEYRQRIVRLFRACEWGRNNPFREIVVDRIEQARAEHQHEVAAAKQEGGSPF